MNPSVSNCKATNRQAAHAFWSRPLHAALPLVLLCCFAVPLAPAAPAAPQKPADKIIGAWRLVSVEGNSPVRRVDYDHPTGFIIYDRSGWMSVQIAIHGERKAFAKGYSNGTAEEKAEAFDTYFAYYGTYTVDAKAETVTHHIVDYTYPGMRGHDNVRWFELQGDNRLVLIPTENSKFGTINRKDATYKLIWERIQ
jgi:hypothetical protein